MRTRREWGVGRRVYPLTLEDDGDGDGGGGSDREEKKKKKKKSINFGTNVTIPTFAS